MTVVVLKEANKLLNHIDEYTDMTERLARLTEDSVRRFEFVTNISDIAFNINRDKEFIRKLIDLALEYADSKRNQLMHEFEQLTC